MFSLVQGGIVDSSLSCIYNFYRRFDSLRSSHVTSDHQVKDAIPPIDQFPTLFGVI